MHDRDYLTAAEDYAAERQQYGNFIEKYRIFRGYGLDVRSATENALFQLFGHDCPLVTSF